MDQRGHPKNKPVPGFSLWGLQRTGPHRQTIRDLELLERRLLLRHHLHNYRSVLANLPILHPIKSIENNSCRLESISWAR